MKPASNRIVAAISSPLRDLLVQNSYFQMASAFGPSLISMVFWVIAARFYDASSVGYVVVLFSALNLLTVFASLGLGISLIRFLTEAGPDGNKMINTSMTLGGIASVVAALIYIAGLAIWAPTMRDTLWDPIFAIAFIAFSVVWTLRYIQSCVFLARCQSRHTFTLNMLASGSKLGLLLLAALISASYLGMFAAIGIGMTLALLTGIFIQMPAVQPGYRPAATICRDALHKIGSYTTSNYVSRTLLQIMPFVLPMIALKVLGAEPSAYFYMAWSVGAILIVLPASIFNSLFAMASNNPGRANAETRKALKLLFTILIPAIAGLLLLADLVLELFGADYSENGANLLRIIAISVVPYSINYLHITMDRVNLASSNLIVTSAAMALLSLGLAYVFAAEWGLFGVGAGWLFGQTAVSVVSAFRLLRGPLRGGALTPPPAPQ